MARTPRGTDREAARLQRGLERTLREARARTRRAVRKTVAIADGEERMRRSRAIQVAWRRLPATRRTSSSPGAKRHLPLGRARYRGTHTIHFALAQTGSARDAVEHQKYIERDGACVASMGNIADTPEERQRLWRELEARAVKRAGRIELGRGIVPEVKRAVLDELSHAPGPTPGGLERAYLERLRRLDAPALDDAKFSVRTVSKDEHSALLERISNLIETTALRDPGDATRSRHADAPERADWPPPGVHVVGARTAAIVIGRDAPQGTHTTIARMATTREEARALGLERADWEAWQREPGPAAEAVLRTTPDVADAILQRLRTEQGVEKDTDIPGVILGSRKCTQARLERGAPPAMKRALVDWWIARSGGDNPWPGDYGKMQWERVRDARVEDLDNEEIQLRVPTRDGKDLEARLKSVAAQVRAAPDAPGHTSRHEPRPRRRKQDRTPGLREFTPTESIVQRRIVIELAHELGDRDREEALRTWCKANLTGLAWHAVIHEPEVANDKRNWHAHVLYSNVAVERRKSGYGWTFEDEPRRPKPTETIRALSGNGPLRGKGRNLLIQQWRRDICALQNERLKKHGVDKVYDHRSYRAMGVDRVPGEHLGPGRFRRELDGTARATGPQSPRWSDAEEALRERLRREGADRETRDAACELLELHRLVHSLPPDAAGARATLELERDEAGRDFLALAGPTAAAAANREINDWLDDVVLAPEPDPENWWQQAARDIDAITDPWLAGATAESRWAHRISDPHFRAMRDVGDPDADAVASLIEQYRITTAPARERARDALASAPTERDRDRAAEQVAATVRSHGFDSTVQALGHELGTEIATRARRAKRRTELTQDIRRWAMACRLADDPRGVREATRMVQRANVAALEENLDLATRFAAVAGRTERGAAVRQAWQRASTPDDVAAVARRYRRLVPALTPRERRALARRIPLARAPQETVGRLRAALADPSPAGSTVLRSMSRADWTAARTFDARSAAAGRARLRTESREDAALADAIATLDATPDSGRSDIWLRAERDHANAIARSPEAAARFDAAAAPHERDLAAALPTWPAEPNDDTASIAGSIERGWPAARRARAGATGPAWDRHVRHAAARLAEETDAARVALRDGDREALRHIARDPNRLRWLDADTRRTITDAAAAPPDLASALARDFDGGRG